MTEDDSIASKDRRDRRKALIHVAVFGTAATGLAIAATYTTGVTMAVLLGLAGSCALTMAVWAAVWLILRHS